jgi:hypothetical protein
VGSGMSYQKVNLTIRVQVKTIKGGAWQFQANAFLDIEIINNVQKVKGQAKLHSPNLICVFVLLSEHEKDEFFIFRLIELQKFFKSLLWCKHDHD